MFKFFLGKTHTPMLITFDQKEYEKLDDNSYRLEKRRLQIELLKLQEDVIKNNRKVCIVFEGRDTAGKSSASKFFTQYLIPKKKRNLILRSKLVHASTYRTCDGVLF